MYQTEKNVVPNPGSIQEKTSKKSHIQYSVFWVQQTCNYPTKLRFPCTIQVSAALKNTQVPKSIHVLNVISGPCSLRILLMSETLVPPIGDYK